MNKAARERRHQAALESINQVTRVVGRGDRMRVDHEGTLLERAHMMCHEISAYQATERGLAAFERLLCAAEERGTPCGRDVFEFLCAVRDNKPLPLASLRGHPPAIGDDMLAVLDAFRHARLNLAEHVDGGPRRVARALAHWQSAGA